MGNISRQYEGQVENANKRRTDKRTPKKKFFAMPEFYTSVKNVDISNKKFPFTSPFFTLFEKADTLRFLEVRVGNSEQVKAGAWLSISVYNFTFRRDFKFLNLLFLMCSLKWKSVHNENLFVYPLSVCKRFRPNLEGYLVTGSFLA